MDSLRTVVFPLLDRPKMVNPPDVPRRRLLHAVGVVAEAAAGDGKTDEKERPRWTA
jgi:hypothetical protein